MGGLVHWGVISPLIRRTTPPAPTRHRRHGNENSLSLFETKGESRQANKVEVGEDKVRNPHDHDGQKVEGEAVLLHGHSNPTVAQDTSSAKIRAKCRSAERHESIVDLRREKGEKLLVKGKCYQREQITGFGKSMVVCK